MATGTDMRLDHTELGNKLLNMKNDGILTDILIYCDKVTFSAHTCVLSNSSLFFRKIFAEENSWKQLTKELHLDNMGIQGDVLESVVDYMYCGSIKMNIKNFRDIVKTADYLVMKDLSELALKFLQWNIKKENCLKLYLSLRSCELSLGISEEILATLWQTLEAHFYDFVINQEEMLHVDAANITHLLSKGIRKNFNLSNVLKFVYKWIQKRSDDNMLDVAEQLISVCLELNNLSSVGKGTNQSNSEAVHSLQLLIDISRQKIEKDSNNDVTRNLMAKLTELLSQLTTCTDAKSKKIEDSLISMDETEKQSLTAETEMDIDENNCQLPVEYTKIKQEDKCDLTLNGSCTVSPCPELTDEEVSNKKSSKSLSTSLDKIKVKAFEKLVQDRVSSFLQGQISYTQNKTKINVVKTKAVSKGRNTANKSLKKPTYKRTRSSKEKVFASLPKRRKTRKTFRSIEFDEDDEKTEEDIVMNQIFDVEDNEDDEDYVDDTFSTKVRNTVPVAECGTDKGPDPEQENGNVKSKTDGGTRKSRRKSAKIKVAKNDKDDKIKDQGMEDSIQHFCLVCFAEFKKKSQLDRHMLNQHENKDNVNEENIELLKKTGKPDNFCIVCYAEFKRRSHLIRHMLKQHKDVEIWNCGKCGETFKDTQQFIDHGRNHLTDIEEKLIIEQEKSGNVEYKCVICSKQFPKVLSIKAHLIQHRVALCKTEGNDKNIKEEDEEKKKADKATKQIPKTPTIYTCNHCSSTFKRRDHLTRHILCLHSDNFPFSCELCDKKFKLRYQLTEHMTQHNSAESKGEEEKSVLCYICGATMKSQKYLKRHLNTHLADQKRFTCKICEKSYSQAVTLQVHLRKHTGAHPYQCEICSMMFAVKSNLLRHQRRHRGEKRYKCDQCGKGFLMVGDLKRHYTTHTGEKNYPCKYCGKRFNCRSKVPQHERIHTGEKPYACQYCGKRFIQSGDKKRHEATHGNIEGKQKRLTLYEMANPTENQESQQTTATTGTQGKEQGNTLTLNNPQESRPIQEGHVSQVEGQLDSKVKGYDMDDTVNSIINFAITSREGMPTSSHHAHYTPNKPPASYDILASQTHNKQAQVVGSSACIQDLSRPNAPPNMSLVPMQAPQDEKLKVVVVQNATPTLSFETVEVPNQVFFLQKDSSMYNKHY